MEGSIEKRKPLPLLRNIRYPTYQLWAIAGDANNQDNVLKICILQTMQWLRERFREHELPKEINVPPPEDYKKIELSQFTNIHLKHGYSLEIIWLPEEKIWTLQLTEPDLGPDPGVKKQTRQPVPGRIFETNMSYKTTDKGILCGFQTMVSEPVGTTEDCEVFRLGVIKELKRNPKVGLHQIWELKEEPHNIESSNDIKNFNRKFSSNERTVPIIVISEYAETSGESKQSEIIPDLDKLIKGNLKSSYLFTTNTLQSQKDVIIRFNSPVLPAWLKDLSYKLMGYGHFFVVSDGVRKEFNGTTGYDLPNGGVMFLPPHQMKEKEIIYPYKTIVGNGFSEKLHSMIQSYSKERIFDFSQCCFVPQAQIIQDNQMLENIHSEKELRKLYALKLSHHEDQDSKRIAEIEGEHQRRYQKLEQELEKAIKKAKAAEDKYKRQQMSLVQLNTVISDLAKRLEITKTRPSKPASMCDWVAQHFGSRIIIHARAQRMIKDIQNEEIDLTTLCDALEYLANEHWDFINGNIDDKECQRLCSLYYNRPFEFGECGDRNIRDYASDYVISHKKANVPLTHHIKVGKDSKRLVRIYYFYDKSERKIVIGSMPKHLKTSSYS